MDKGATPTSSALRRRRLELHVLLVLTLALAPALAVATVGGYGLSVWVYQMIAGPPKAPHKSTESRQKLIPPIAQLDRP